MAACPFGGRHLAFDTLHGDVGFCLVAEGIVDFRYWDRGVARNELHSAGFGQAHIRSGFDTGPEDAEGGRSVCQTSSGTGYRKISLQRIMKNARVMGPPVGGEGDEESET